MQKHFLLSFVFVALASWLGGGVSGQFASIDNVHALARRNSTGLSDAVTWDANSVFINGQRIFILSAEVHPWRLPNPDLWADVFEKIKANGFNTVSFYVNWALHFPTPDTNNGQGDFQKGTYRDIQRFIDEARKAGLWLIARPGPYINAETTGGGFPGWVGNIAGSLRTNNPNFKQAWTPYMTVISKIIAENQITNGGPIILVQAENEFSASANNSPYMQDVIDTYRSNGVVVPITHNDQHAGQAGNFSPDLPGQGRVNIYCGDSYPQGANRWAQVQSIYWSAHKNVAPNNPLCLAEFGGGFLLNWGAGSPARGGTGYEKFSNDLTDQHFETIFYKENYAQTATILSIYMLFGGTNWGQTAAPVAYTSYDYGGGIDENRVPRLKMNEMRLQGLFLRVSRDLLAANLVANGTNFTTSPIMYAAELRNPQTQAGFYMVRHNDSTSTALTTTQLNVTTSRGSLLIPKVGQLTFNGRDAKILVTDYTFGSKETKILYSTTEIMTWTSIGATDYILVYAAPGETGETAFLFDTAPNVNMGTSNTSSSVFNGGVLTLNYGLQGTQFFTIRSGSSTIVVVALDKPTAYTWSAPTISGPGVFGDFFSVGTNETVLVGGPFLVRSASISRDTLTLVGDLNGTATPLEVIAPPSVQKISWNGKNIRITQSAHGSLQGNLGSAQPNVTLPSLTNWKVSGGLPELDVDFDDSEFTLADLTTTNYTNLPPLAGDKVLYSQQYGFYGGNIISRGHFNASGLETGIRLSVQGGFAFGYSAWLNGIFLGSNVGSATVSMTTDLWDFPAGSLKQGQDNVIVVVQDHTGISETNTNGGKEPRGIRGYEIIGGQVPFSEWRIQGNQGGAKEAPDSFRGYLNEGGLYAERIGAHLPGFPDDSWSSGSPTTGLKKAGINFYRTSFNLNLPDGFDIPIRLSITPSEISSRFRAQIYLNGWQFGKYVNDIGPQTLFVLPEGLLRRKGTNTLALSLWSLDQEGASIAGLQLVADGSFETSLRFKDVDAPDFVAQSRGRPAALSVEPM
ncbi:hypothetical protein EYR40_008555 [Pleurotus pulmonarius]|nr:hypothetical protein EYR36_009374 [Pleurotus pulmonarius]KAF4592871.1 hypothetical protein EYR38_008577 [Pleurotus pulmonarius]KAF4593761.1 hypothetical protein EYR40_008555 [Pleurotus pulmonarius]